MFLDRPAIGSDGLRVAVNGVLHHRDGSVAEQDAADIGEDVALAKPLDVVVAVIRAAEGQLEFVGLANIEHQIVAHRCTPYCDGVRCRTVSRASGLPRREGLP